MARSGLTTFSGTITTGGVAQWVTPAPPDSSGQADRSFLLIHNPDTTVDLWYDFDIAAAVSQPSIRLPAGVTHVYDHFIPTNRISIIGASTGKGFVVKVGGGA